MALDFKNENIEWYRREVTWGNNVATFPITSAGTFGHEFGHIFQVQQQGWAQFQGKGLIEQTQYSFYLLGLSKINPYNTPNTNESGADEYLILYGN